MRAGDWRPQLRASNQQPRLLGERLLQRWIEAAEIRPGPARWKQTYSVHALNETCNEILTSKDDCDKMLLKTRIFVYTYLAFLSKCAERQVHPSGHVKSECTLSAPGLVGQGRKRRGVSPAL